MSTTNEQPPFLANPQRPPNQGYATPLSGSTQLQPYGNPPVPVPHQLYAAAGAYGDHAAVAAVLGKKSAGVAAVLSILLVGAGQMYCGRVGRGFAFLAAAVASYLLMFVLIGFLLAPAVFIWALIDAINLASRHNAELLHRITYGPRYR
jgi:TM2 domain-containing membrane protein YozV